MSPLALLNSEESSILAALCQTDQSAWCFLPQPNREVSYFSTAFMDLWDIPDNRLDGDRRDRDGHVRDGRDRDRRDREQCGSLSEDSIAAALAAQGIDPSQFFSRVIESANDGSPPILLVRRDSLKLQAEVSVVTSADRIAGHLVRFREIVEPNVIDAILRMVKEAQRRVQILTPREQEILRGVYDGRTNKAISISTRISEKTVEKHRSRIMQKLNLNCSAELFRLASRAMLLADIQQTSGTGCPAGTASFTTTTGYDPPSHSSTTGGSGFPVSVNRPRD